jgi:hypothetical protein
MRKNCPMRAMLSYGQDKCEEGDCAWYDEADHQCAVLAITRHLYGITYRLAELNLDGMTIEKEE